MTSLFVVAYRAELFLWVPLVALFVLAPAARRWLLPPLVASVLAAVYEGYMTFVSRPVAIRLDILLVMLVTGAVDGICGAFLAADARRAPDRARRIAAAALCLAVPAAGAIGWSLAMVHSAQVGATLDEGRGLRFEAAFRDDATQGRAFGQLRPGANPWAGYYAGDDERFRHLVINDAGDFWLYSGALYETRGHGAASASDANRFEGRGTGGTSANTRLVIERRGDAYGLQVDFGAPGMTPAKAYGLRRTQAPRFPKPAAAGDAVRFVGEFSGAYGANREGFWLVQLWLWEAGGHVWGRYIHDYYRRGAPRDFIWAEPIEASCARGCRELSFPTGRGPRTLTRVADDAFEGDYGSPPQRLVLRRGEALPGFLLDLAPLATEKENRLWLEAVMTGHMIRWDVPP